MTITEQLDAAYSEGKIAVIVTNWKMFPIKRRETIRAVKNGIQFQQGKRWTFAFAYQVRFIKKSDMAWYTR